MQFCGNCGANIDENALVCNGCGAPQKSVASAGEDDAFGFKQPDQYEGVQSAEQEFEGIPVESGEQPSWTTAATQPAMIQPTTTPSLPPKSGEETIVEKKEGGEHNCPNCKSTLIFSLARGLWFCPSCGTEVPNLPPPYGAEEPEEDEAALITQQMLQQQSAGVPAGPIPEKGETKVVSKGEKPPDEVGGVKRSEASESIIEIQNFLEGKSKKGLYSMDADTAFESMKLAFTQNDYPAVIQLNKQIKDIYVDVEKDADASKAGPSGESLPPGGYREQAIRALQSARDLIFEAERLGYDLTESKKIYKQAEPAFRAGDYQTAANFAHDTEESVNAVLGGKRLAKAPTYQPRYSPKVGGIDAVGIAGAPDEKPSFFTKYREIIFKFILPIGGLIILMAGAVLAWMAVDDHIWNPFNGRGGWGPYNTTGVILGVVAMIIGLLFAILPFLLTKKVYVRMEPPKPVTMR